MSAAADFINVLNHPERHLPAVIFEDRENGAELLSRKPVFLSDLVLGNDQKILVRRNCESCKLGNDGSRTSDCLWSAVSLVVPIHLFDLCLLIVVDEVSAFLLEPAQQRVINRSIDDQVAVGRTAGSVV